MKKCDRDDEVESDRLKDKGDSGETERNKWEKSAGHTKTKEPKEKYKKCSCCIFECVNAITVFRFHSHHLKNCCENVCVLCVSISIVEFSWRVIRSSGMATAAGREKKTRRAEKRSASGSGITMSLTSSCAARRRPNGAKATVTTGQRKMATTMATPTALRWGISQVKRTEMRWGAGRNVFVIR